MISFDSQTPTADASRASSLKTRIEHAKNHQPDALLSALEFLVYRQLTCPNREALTLAAIDAYRGRKPRGPIRVDVTPANLAAGIGMPLAQFEELHTSIKEKVAHHMSLQPHEQAHHSAVVALEKHFDIHVPRSSEPLVVRRMFTIKARADHHKVTPDIAELLKTVGAKPPVVDANRVLTCYGILWEANNSICRNCDLNAACKAEAANVGLLDVALSAKLFPPSAKVRTATKADPTDGHVETVTEVTPAPERPARAAATPKSTAQKKPSLVIASAADEEIVSYAEKNFRGFDCHRGRYYTHKENPHTGKGAAYLFSFKVINGAQRLRFVEPSEKLAEKLEKIGLTYYLPLGLDHKMVEKLTERQATEKPSRIK